jgi:transposase
VFLDNLSVHHSKIVRQFMKDKELEVLFNVPYSPDYNPIENVFNILKQKFKKLRMSAISTD